MLDLLKINNRKKIKSQKIEINNISKHYPSSIREWNNSIYNFYKNSISLIPWSTQSSMNIIKNYFNLFNKSLERRTRTKRLLLRFRRLSSNRIYFSGGEFKHTNNNVLINLYVFNRQKYNYIIRLKYRYLRTMLRNKNIIIKFTNKLKNLYEKGQQILRNHNNTYLFIKALNVIEKNNNYKLSSFKSLSKYTKRFYKILLRKYLRKIRTFFVYKKYFYINKSKLNYTYLRFLKKSLEKIYNKNVEFNIINLKRFYLNSDIFSESVKLKLIRNKRAMKKLLKRIDNKIKIREDQIDLNDSRFNKMKPRITNTNQHLIINNLKYRHVTGFRLETKGRITVRYTASRSRSKLIYKGNLLNIDPSFKLLSTMILRGNLKSNIQHTKLSSKGRIGSFGIKGWISSN